MALKQREEGCADVQRSIELCPPDQAATHLALVGELYGETAQWDRAQVAFAQAVELDALSVDSWHLLALVQLAQADQEGYRATCARMLQQFGRTEDPGCAELSGAHVHSATRIRRWGSTAGPGQSGRGRPAG